MFKLQSPSGNRRIEFYKFSLVFRSLYICNLFWYLILRDLRLGKHDIGNKMQDVTVRNCTFSKNRLIFCLCQIKMILVLKSIVKWRSINVNIIREILPVAATHWSNTAQISAVGLSSNDSTIRKLELVKQPRLGYISETDRQQPYARTR